MTTTKTNATGTYPDGLRSLDSETRVDELPLKGSLPDWLQGSLLRTGPARWEVGGKSMNHWFDGFAMLHRFGIGDGKVSYANRFLESKAYRAADADGELAYAEFATDPCRSLFSRVSSLFDPKLTDNANVNLVKLGERFIAMTETPIPVEFDAETLETAGVAFEAPGLMTTAHPHLERSTGGMLNYVAKVGPRNRYRFFHLGPEAEEPEVLAEIPVKHPSYQHSFGLTPNWFVLAEWPFVVNPLSIPLSGRPYIENFKWKPELGTRFWLLPRGEGSPLGPFETDAWFAFHHINSYEDEDGTIVVDACVYPDAQIVKDLYLEHLRAGKPAAQSEVRRFRIDPDSGVTSERLVEESLELPRINYGRCSERPYRYAWGVASGDSGWLEKIVKADLAEGTTTSWSEEHCFPGEPIFVARPGEGTAEDDGVLLSVVLDADEGRSFLLVLDAADLSEVARAEAPHHIPYGFHGQFAPA